MTPPGAPLPPNVSRDLDALYRRDDAEAPSPSLVLDGDAVGVAVSASGVGDFAALLDALRALGMRLTSSHEPTGSVRGMLPIGRLPDAAALPQVGGITPMRPPARG